MKKSTFTRKIESHLIKTATRKKFSEGGAGMETSSLKFLNFSMPALRNELRTLVSATGTKTGEDLYHDMQKLWFESDIFDAKIIAVCWLDLQSTDFLVRHHKMILSWAHEIDNWAHSDGLSSVYARMFEQAQALLLPTYLKWNKHENSWLRRKSMVSTFYYSRYRRKQPDFALAKGLVHPHLPAKEYYVQKGVGWTLREMYNVYPSETVKYIENNIDKISPIAWVAASEKLPPLIKQPLLKKRKAGRKLNKALKRKK